VERIGVRSQANVAETETGFEVTLELPGMKPEEFHVEFRDGALWITGEKKEEHEKQGKTYHRLERRYGEFRRVFRLPVAVNEEMVTAEYKEGILRVAVPKIAEVKPKRVEVKT
jgi:HSP20 family protein